MAFGGLQGFFARHGPRSTNLDNESVLSESKNYPGLSKDGIKHIEAQTKEIQQMLDEAPNGSVLFIGGSSEEERTKSTAEAFGDVLQRNYAKNSEVLVLGRKDVTRLREKQGGENALRTIENLIEQNPTKKMVVAYPLMIKEFSLQPKLREKGTAAQTEFSRVLNTQAASERDSAELFIASEGKAATADGREVVGISGQDAAEEQLRGMRRLKDFAEKYAHGRPVLIGYVSHGWTLDAVATFLANNGRVNVEGFKKIGGTMIDSAEVGKIQFQDGNTTFLYRGKQYTVSPELLES